MCMLYICDLMDLGYVFFK